MEEDIPLNKKLDYLIAKVTEREQEKKFKLPLGIKMQGGKLRKNFCLVLFIQANGSVLFKFVKIEDNTIKIRQGVDDIYYDASSDYILRYKKYPLLILPEWNIKPIKRQDGTIVNEVQPFEAKENFKEAVKEGALTSSEKILLRVIKLNEIKPKMKINFMVVLIIAAVCIGGYFLLKYMKIV